MRYSDQELVSLACSPPTLEGRLWYKQQGRRREGFRERQCRLKTNFLFYFRIHESSQSIEPLGALLLERCSIQEEPMDSGRHVFSLAYQDERDRKHYFATASTEEFRRWIAAIQTASYERLKSTFILLQRELARIQDIQHHKSSTAKPARPAPRRPPNPPAIKVQAVGENKDSSLRKEDIKGEGVLIDV